MDSWWAKALQIQLLIQEEPLKNQVNHKWDIKPKEPMVVVAAISEVILNLYKQTLTKLAISKYLRTKGMLSWTYTRLNNPTTN